MSPVWATVLGVSLLLCVLAFAIVHPRRLPEVVAALPAALLAWAIGLVTTQEVVETTQQLAPTVGFLAAVLVLAHLAEVDGVFSWLGDVVAVGSRRSPVRLLALVFVVASLTTAVLSLDATVILLTPVIIVAARRVGARPAPTAYASVHLSNSASLLLPVSNLTNLLAFHASGLGFLAFTAAMGAPWLVAIALEWVVFRLFFRRQLQPGTTPRTAEPLVATHRAPRTALAILGAVLIGLLVGQSVGVEPVWVAVAGAVVMAVRALVRHRVTWRQLVREANVPFLVFVLALGVVVDAATEHGVESLIAQLVPTGTDLWSLLAVATVAAVLANLVNNLPATLVLLAVLGSTAGPLTVLAVLIGVNLGPNLTYTGSLATLLWRRVLHRQDLVPSLSRFSRLGAITVPLTLIGATVALWAVAGPFL